MFSDEDDDDEYLSQVLRLFEEGKMETSCQTDEKKMKKIKKHKQKLALAMFIRKLDIKITWDFQILT